MLTMMQLGSRVPSLPGQTGFEKRDTNESDLTALALGPIRNRRILVRG